VPFAHDGERARTSRVADRRGWVRRSGTPAASGRRLGDRTIRHAQARGLSRLACACRIALCPSPRAARGPTAHRRGSECSPPTVKECGVDPRPEIRVDSRKSASRGFFAVALALPGNRETRSTSRSTASKTNSAPLKRRASNSQTEVARRSLVEVGPSSARGSITRMLTNASGELGVGSWELTVSSERLQFRLTPLIAPPGGAGEAVNTGGWRRHDPRTCLRYVVVRSRGWTSALPGTHLTSGGRRLGGL
jgi:hypothetical protein